MQYQIAQMPLPPVLYKFEQMRLFADLPVEARGTLTKIAEGLFDKYYLQPRTALLRGRHEEALKQTDRISSVVEHADSALQIEETQFQRQIAQWRERVNDA